MTLGTHVTGTPTVASFAAANWIATLVLFAHIWPLGLGCE